MGGGGDQRFYGRVAYVHAGGIDQPLELMRMDVWQAFSAVPHANWRGTYDVLTLTGSRYAECGPQIGYELGTQPECFPFDLASINAWGDLKPKNPDNTVPAPFLGRQPDDRQPRRERIAVSPLWMVVIPSPDRFRGA